MTKSRTLAAALILCATAAIANAQTASAAPPPVADKGITAQYNCVDEENKAIGTYGHWQYRVELKNKCEQRLKCLVYGAAFGAQGVQKGRAVMILAAKSRGAASIKVMQFRIKEVGGMTTVSRHCWVN
jgi:Spy/CpxP family protein refolding chaperone